VPALILKEIENENEDEDDWKSRTIGEEGGETEGLNRLAQSLRKSTASSSSFSFSIFFFGVPIRRASTKERAFDPRFGIVRAN
jgi:hypothetical protein